jgi:cell division inhibitor SepF
MAGAMRKMGIYHGLVEDNLDEQIDGRDYDGEYGDDSEYADYSEYEPEPAPARREPTPAAATTTSSATTTSTRSWAEQPESATTSSTLSSSIGSSSTRLATSGLSDRASYLGRGYADRSRSQTLSQQMGNSMADTDLDPTPSPLARITTLHPRTYNEARVIGEQFREGVPVIMNLTELDDSDAKRLVDFAAGLIFGLRGSIDRVTNRVFLLSPQNVNVTAEDKARLAEGGFFNQS